MLVFEFNTKIAGSQYYFDSIKIEPKDQLELELEPTNKFDPNAIKILFQKKIVGYVPKEISILIKSKIDDDIFMIAECTGWKSQFEILIKIMGHQTRVNKNFP